MIETYLRSRVQERVQIATLGARWQKGLVKPSPVHQEFRVLRRMLNVAVRKNLLLRKAARGMRSPSYKDRPLLQD